ncbi:MAG: DUF4956 domain-containing protein [Candidatus Kapabacteria bacterium]|nr:DUF4956 domain-containing protein [Candidatus Kapabacteria bacterium]
MDFNSFLGFSIINTENFLNLILRFVINLITIILLVRFIYFKIRSQRTYLFTFIMFNVIVFLVCSFLNQITLSLGFAFGIFAIFSILRYRTISIPIKEMTYLFIAISIALINAVSNSFISLIELLFTNAAIIISTLIIEKVWMKNENVKLIIYEKIELIKSQNHTELLKDLIERTGLNIHRFEIGKIDFLRDIAEIKVYYFNNSSKHFYEEKEADDDD